MKVLCTLVLLFLLFLHNKPKKKWQNISNSKYSKNEEKKKHRTEHNKNNIDWGNYHETYGSETAFSNYLSR